jgi:hypothetical protein
MARLDRVTRITLFERLHRNPPDGEAWRDFEKSYGPMIFAWCHRWGMQDADAEDITISGPGQ